MQKFSLQLVTPPAVEPILLREAKLHLRVDFTDDDDLITALISAARQHVENILNRAIYDQTWCMTLDQFPYAESLRTISPSTRENYFGNGYYFSLCQVFIPFAKVSSINSITYLDGDNQTVMLDASTYVSDLASEPARIVPANGGSWPYPSCYVPGSVKITFTASTYGDGSTVANCPAPIQQAMLLLIGHWYANREAASEKPLTNLPFAVDALLAPYRNLAMAV
ncbi:head-tail connector protein [Granulicella cerasi]|uniref:Head-tail connector protein n=1 Tax=Granulicella cerasi TaxID=741063 RepID=A0ABW1Z5J2_9BACT|nr:head-tail connector protein [Granulicella cerasi]